ncbi:MAG: hypothetical protein AAF098_17135, partial [Pseudomonadota bacterium]
MTGLETQGIASKHVTYAERSQKILMPVGFAESEVAWRTTTVSQTASLYASALLFEPIQSFLRRSIYDP